MLANKIMMELLWLELKIPLQNTEFVVQNVIVMLYVDSSAGNSIWHFHSNQQRVTKPRNLGAQGPERAAEQGEA